MSFNDPRLIGNRQTSRIEVDVLSRGASPRPWKEIVDDLYFPFAQEVISHGPSPSMSYGMLPMRDFSICKIEMDGDMTVTGWRSWKMIREHNRRAFLIWLTVKGRYECQQGGNTFVSDSGNICLTRSDQPFRITAFPDAAGSNLAYQVLISPSMIDRYFHDAHHCFSNSYECDTGSIQLYQRIIEEIYERSSDAIVDILDPMARSLLESIAISFRKALQIESMAQETGKGKYATQVIRCTEDYLTDPDISPSRVAQKCGVSTRHVHRVFRSLGTSFTRYVYDLRLDRAYRMLTDQRFFDMTIGEIAFDAGFNGQSHFNRVFLAKFGCRPSVARAG